MASIIDFQNLYTVIKELLPDLGGLVSDFPKILASAEANPPKALKYIMETTSKLLQDVSSREGVYIASSKCNDLATALKSKRSIPPVINQHLDMIIEKINLPVVSKNIDEAYNAFESLVSLLQWQHGKYYIVNDDDFDMLLSPEDTASMYFKSDKKKTGRKEQAKLSDKELLALDYVESDFIKDQIKDAGAETGVLNPSDMPKYGIDEDEFKVKFNNESTKPKDRVFYTADEIRAKNAASTNVQKPEIINDDIFSDIIPEIVEEEIKKIVTRQHRSMPKTDSLKKQTGDNTQRQSCAHQKTKIDTSKKVVTAKKTVASAQPNTAGIRNAGNVKNPAKTEMKTFPSSDIPATIISDNKDILPESFAVTKTQLPKEKILISKKSTSSNRTIQSTSSGVVHKELSTTGGASKIIKEVYKPSKGPHPWVYGIIGFAAIGFLIIGIISGKNFRNKNINSNHAVEAKYLFEEASLLKRRKSSINIDETIASYNNVLQKIEQFTFGHPDWNQAFDETVISLRDSRDELKRQLELEKDKLIMIAKVKEALKSTDIQEIQETQEELFTFLLRYPDLHENFDTEINQLEERIIYLKISINNAENLKLAVRQANSLMLSADLSLIYKNLGILKWFFDRSPDDEKLNESLQNLQSQAELRKEFSEIEIRIKYLIGIYDIASKSDNYNEVKVGMDLIMDFIISFKVQIDENPDAPKTIKSSYRELTTKHSLLSVRVIELKEEEANRIFNMLKRDAEDLQYSTDAVEIRILIKKIDDFIVEHPILKNDLEQSKILLNKRLDEINMLGDNKQKITNLIAEATDLISSTNTYEIGSMIGKINDFIRKLPESKPNFDNILKKLESRKKDLEDQKSLSDRMDQLIKQSEKVRSTKSLNDIINVINDINEFKRVSLRNETQSSYFLMKLERELNKLTDRYQELRKVKIIIDTPKNGHIFQTREITVMGKVVNTELKQVRISVAGWKKTVDVFNGIFSTDMMLVSGANLITVESFSNTYIGEASCEVVCTEPRAELYVKLSWERSDANTGKGIARPDLDLYVTEPTGKTVFYDDPDGDSGVLINDSREGEAPEIFEISTLKGHKLIEGTFFIRVKYTEDRSIKRKDPEPGEKLWAGYLPKPTPVKFKLVIFRKGRFYAEYTGEITRMDYIHNGHEAWLAFPQAWWDKTCPVVIAK